MVLVTSGGVGSEDTVILNVVSPPSGEEPSTGTVFAESIAYSGSGGRLNDKHLTVTVSLKDDQGNSVSSASVSMDLYRNGSLYGSTTGTTGSNGTVSFTSNNAPSGTYTTVITGVNAGELVWDGVTPTNSYSK